ncbi:MAG: hypothetical protein M3Z57_06095 [Candidatus Dormibacteraeota bacterium]|nr:hypothetical protein [Candidatus Dormibacteraeota bacterium]
MTLRGRFIALAVIVAVLFSIGIVVLVRSRSADCTVVAPRPSLSPALRALGDFEQSYDVANVGAIEDAATRAAAAMSSDLLGAVAEPPVVVTAANSSLPDAVIVPLRSHVASAHGPPPLVGLVVFLRDCQGNAYFDTVEDDASAQPVLVAFPRVSRDQAVAQLGSAVRLDYVASPVQPRWVTLTEPARSLPAR